MEAVVSTSEILFDGRVRRRGGRRYDHEAPARLYWPLAGVFPAGISVMKTPQSGLDELEPFQKPDGTWHEIASLPLTEPPVSSVETSFRFLNEWEGNWTRRHGRWCKTAEYVTYGELCDEDRPYASEMKEDGSWEEDSDTEFLNRCCSKGRPMHWRGLSIRVDASTEKGFVTIYDYVSAVHPWLMNMREHLVDAKLDDPECACCVPDEAHASTWVVDAGYAPRIDIEMKILTIVKQVRGSSRAPSTPTAYRTILIAFLGEFRTYEIYLTTIEHDPMHMMRYSHPDHDSAVLALIGSINGNKSNAA